MSKIDDMRRSGIAATTRTPSCTARPVGRLVTR
jgi:hypothetical protein